MSGYEYKPGDDHHAATNHYAGPFCGCGDYSCPASSDPSRNCVYLDLD